MMPRFFADMPEPAPGLYEPSATRHGRFGSFSSFVGRVHGRRRAYVVARLLALWMDINTPKDADVEITWKITQCGS